MQPVTKARDEVRTHICNKYGQAQHQSNIKVFLFGLSLIVQRGLRSSKDFFLVIFGNFCCVKAFFINRLYHFGNGSSLTGVELRSEERRVGNWRRSRMVGGGHE